MAAGVVLALSAAIVVGCSAKGTSVPNPTPTPSPSPTPTSTGATPTPTPNYFVSLDYPVGATTDPTYGTINGYGLLSAPPTSTPATTPAPSQVITVSANMTIVFLNFDRTSAHTASLLGPANGMNWPGTFTNVNGASISSPAGTAITSAEFSTGNIPATGGAPIFSLTYNTGALTGMFYFGDFYDYQLNPPMRTVIIIQ